MAVYLGLDIGSNSVGSAWVDDSTGHLTTGTSVFPAGVDESEDKRGEPKNAKRRMTRRTRITLARRAKRKRELRLKLIEVGLLPRSPAGFKTLLEAADPWELRRRGLDGPLSPFEFGRVLLHLAQRRGALGLRAADPDEEETEGAPKDDGKVKAAIKQVQAKMVDKNARTFGEFIALVRAERVTPITSEDRRPPSQRRGPREWRTAVRNKAASYEHCADRAMIRDEFATLWDAQRKFDTDTARLLTAELRLALDDESGDTLWRHKGLLFGQRRQSWDLGTLGRCVLEPTDRCAPHADMHASRYLVVETVNNLRITERGREARPLTPEERERIKVYLSGPLGMEKGRRKKGDGAPPPDQPKRTVSVTDLRNLMGWGRASKTAQFRFNIENDEERTINTDWFSRQIIHGAFGAEFWNELSERQRDSVNRALLKFDPEREDDAGSLRAGAQQWWGLDAPAADRLINAWKGRPKLEKRLNLSRRAILNLLPYMERFDRENNRWPTQQEARKAHAQVLWRQFEQTGDCAYEVSARRYATGAKGATARDRHYMKKHLLKKNGRPIIGPDGLPLHEPPPAPLISNPVVRKAIHEVRRHLVEYLTAFGRKPDDVYVELAREARMGKVDADRLLLKNRLRNRIRNDMVREFNLESRTTTQQRAAVDRVVLCVQQNCVCPLCGQAGLSPRQAAVGEGCEVAHIIPRASGGHNGLSNLVLAHIRCNREMRRRTPRQYWSDGPGFERGSAWVESIYGDIERPKFSEIKSATGNSLWVCYFTRRDDQQKIEQFKKDITDIQEMTPRQEAATKYAARQVMAYIADALYNGQGLPERGGERRIYATDGLWTSRLRREWGLFFDPHEARSHGLGDEQQQQRKEKNRGDHRHHAIDAVVIAYCTRQVQIAWEERERRADRDGINTADEETMENYRRAHPLDPPPPFKTREDFRAAVKRAVFGEDEVERPICHRPVKRKLIGALHEETLFGPVLDRAGNLTDNYTARKSVLSLDPNHLRMPRPETETEAIDRLAARRRRTDGVDERTARKWARAVVSSPGYKAAIVDPPPGKSGIVRDLALRARLRHCLEEAGLKADDFSANEVKRLFETGAIKHASGVPIRSVVLMRTMSDPVVIDRQRPDYASGRPLPDGEAASRRAYVGGNNHHIEIRVAVDKKGRELWSGDVVPAFVVAQRKLARLRALRDAGIGKPADLRKLAEPERRRLSPVLRSVEAAHPLVDRRDDDAKGGRFAMSLCEGEMLCMKHKQTGEVGYFVVAKLDKPRSIVVVPHWDARAATERKDAEGRKVPNSKREQFAVTPSDLKALAPPGHDHAVKVRVSPLGKVTVLERD